MHELSPIVLARLSDYVAGVLDADEVAETTQWISESPELQKAFAHLSRAEMGRSERDSSKRAHSDRDLSVHSRRHQQAASMAVRLTQRIARESGPVPVSVLQNDRPGTAALLVENGRPPHANGPGKYVPAFASRISTDAYRAVLGGMLCLAILIGGWTIWGGRSQEDRTAAMSTYATGNGERATITLPDGSVVSLNVASRIHVPADYASGNRTLHLSGEALFTVLHREGAPFTVVAGPSRTSVLGTSFVVRHYPTDSAATIAVRDGKVMVDSTVLIAAQQLSVGWTSRSRVYGADSTQFAFASGGLSFRKATLGEIIPALNRWYDIEIRLADPSLADRRVTGDFGAGSAADFTSIVTETFNGIGVIQNGRTITLYRR